MFQVNISEGVQDINSVMQSHYSENKTSSVYVTQYCGWHNLVVQETKQFFPFVLLVTYKGVSPI